MQPSTLPVAELKSALAGLGKVINTKASLPVTNRQIKEVTPAAWAKAHQPAAQRKAA
ncbi:hypothetical protein [Prosthecobacter sp.]|uniref:hypothetical protein n=1 Tax=Prosthecobacter sp. TaxID=1965333 RepID=UPI002AB9EC1A|nr:hypothetical protein [Prosthecobacter sp.]MDZ4401186.1 hypothetical protein [Prosthecobacter sp.]